MPKPEWGVKRACPSCSARFYDLKRTPIVCPECDAPFETPAKDKAASLKADLARAQSAEAARSKEVIDDGDSADQTDDNQDDDQIDDDDDKDGGSTGPALSDEDSDDRPVKFQDNALLDDDDDDDGSTDIGDAAKSKDGET